MKRIGHLYEKFISLDNLILAVKNATKNKKHRRGIVKEAHAEPERYALRAQKILERGFIFSPPREKVRRERNKLRCIKVPKFFPDQIVHWALMQVIDPIIYRGMYRYCCGSVPGRGNKGARKAIIKFTKNDARIKYVYKADIHHFFASVDNDILRAKFRRVIKDKKILALIDAVLENGGEGLPIGYYTSQGFSNFYLQSFDHFVKEKLKIKHYVRYVDDIVMLDRNKRKLHKAHKEFERFLRPNKLALKKNWQVWKYGTRPIDFVGYRFYKKYIILRKHIFYSLTRVVRKIKRFGLRLRQCERFVSYIARARVSNFKGYYLNRIKPVIKRKTAQNVISFFAKQQQAAAA